MKEHLDSHGYDDDVDNNDDHDEDDDDNEVDYNPMVMAGDDNKPMVVICKRARALLDEMMMMVIMLTIKMKMVMVMVMVMVTIPWWRISKRARALEIIPDMRETPATQAFLTLSWKKVPL